MASLTALLTEVRACTRCAAALPLGPRPVLQMHAQARILVAGQAPGAKVHASGERLRQWMGISRAVFYDPMQVAIVPMGLCFPGTGPSGDLPPRAECAPAWRAALLAHLKHLQLTLVIGQYAQAYHLPGTRASLTQAVQAWRTQAPDVMALPHPSPRNNIWLKRNPWFETDVLPLLQIRVAAALTAVPPC